MSLSPRSRVELAFSARAGRDPQGVVFSPGRLVLLGEHLDHQGGPVLAVALPAGIWCAWGVRPDRRVVVSALNANATDQFTQDQWVPSGRRWADLARGACAAVGSGGRRLPGIDLVLFGDLPPRQGMASSAAYTTAVLRSLLAAIGESPAPAEVARTAAAVEARWAGVECGPMDPYVACVGRPGEVVALDCGALRHEVLPLPAGTDLIGEDTGVQRRLSETPYNRRREELDQARSFLAARGAPPPSLVDLHVAAFEEAAAAVPEPFRSRARHVVTEVDRVRRATEALARGDGPLVGRLMVEGHWSLSRDFASSLPTIDRRVEEILTRPGVLGARLQGAGWGGTIAVLRSRVPPARDA